MPCKMGLVIVGAGDGDAANYFVDEALWRQIIYLQSTRSYTVDEFRELVSWFTAHSVDKDPSMVRPERAPDPHGEVIFTAYTQESVIEQFEQDCTLLGILNIQ